MFATDICGILGMPQSSKCHGNIMEFDSGIRLEPLSVAYTSMTRVYPFENGRNEKIMSYI